MTPITFIELTAIIISDCKFGSELIVPTVLHNIFVRLL